MTKSKNCATRSPKKRIVVVTAAADRIPQQLIDQLKPGGRMVIPVGGWSYMQELILITKDQEGMPHQKKILPISFVPLTGGYY